MAKETVQTKQFKELAERLKLSEGIQMLIYLKKSDTEMPKRVGSATIKEVAMCNWDFEDFCLRKYYAKHGGGEYSATIRGPDNDEYRLVGELASEIEKTEEKKEGEGIGAIFEGIKSLQTMFEKKESGPTVAELIQLLEVKEEKRIERERETEERRDKEHNRRMEGLKIENENRIALMKSDAETRNNELEKKSELQTQRDKEYFSNERMRDKELQAERDKSQKLFYAEFQKLTSQDNALSIFLKGLDFAKDMRGGEGEESIEDKLIGKGIDVVSTVLSANKGEVAAPAPEAPIEANPKVIPPPRPRPVSPVAKMLSQLFSIPPEKRSQEDKEWFAKAFETAFAANEELLDLILDADKTKLKMLLTSMLGVPDGILTELNMAYLMDIHAIMVENLMEPEETIESVGSGESIESKESVGSEEKPPETPPPTPPPPDPPKKPSPPPANPSKKGNGGKGASKK